MDSIVFGFILGTVLGSFVKALADRSLSNRSFLGRSYCPHCKKVLQWYDLLPILSYLFLKGRCRYCRDKIALEYLVVEVIMGVLVGFLFSMSSSYAGMTVLWVLDLTFKVFFITVLAILFLTDLKKMLIPDRIILPAIKISIMFITFITIIKVGYLYYSLNQTRLGQLLFLPYSNYFQRHALMVAEPLFWSIVMGLLIGGFFMALIIITKGKGMGGGDVKLGAFMGLGLGFPNSFLAVMIAFLIGAVWATAAIILGKKRFGQHIAFGPFLVLGSMITLFWGNKILNWYLHPNIP